jgi:hypothetical protein
MPSPEHFIHPFAEVALSNITREYPYAAHHVVASLADIVPAAEKNPAFANSYDWHSSVHMHCLLASLLGTELGRTASWRDEAIEVLSMSIRRVEGHPILPPGATDIVSRGQGWCRWGPPAPTDYFPTDPILLVLAYCECLYQPRWCYARCDP